MDTEKTSGAITEAAITGKSGVETARVDPSKTIETASNQQAPLAADNSKVTVKPLRHFHDSETGKTVTPESEPFEVTRHHAVQLRQNGLVEFESAADERDAVAEHIKSQDAAIKARAEAGKLPANSLGKPLRNPKLNYPSKDEVDAADSKGRS
jgi:hypothetical protein